MYILQQSEPFQAPVFIGYDNISAADCSFMKSVKTDESLLAGLAAAVHIESTKNHSVEGFHIHSHQGHPWNELADSICNFYKNHKPLVVKVPFAPFTRQVCFDYQMFVSLQDPCVYNSLAVDEAHCYNSLKALPPDVVAQRIDNPDYMQRDSSCEASPLFLKCTQFSVQTLAQFSTRKNMLANFIKLRFAIGCFQETRSKTGRAM